MCLFLLVLLYTLNNPCATAPPTKPTKRRQPKNVKNKENVTEVEETSSEIASNDNHKESSLLNVNESATLFDLLEEEQCAVLTPASSSCVVSQKQGITFYIYHIVKDMYWVIYSDKAYICYLDGSNEPRVKVIVSIKLDFTLNDNVKHDVEKCNVFNQLLSRASISSFYIKNQINQNSSVYGGFHIPRGSVGSDSCKLNGNRPLKRFEDALNGSSRDHHTEPTCRFG